MAILVLFLPSCRRLRNVGHNILDVILLLSKNLTVLGVLIANGQKPSIFKKRAGDPESSRKCLLFLTPQGQIRGYIQRIGPGTSGADLKNARSGVYFS